MREQPQKRCKNMKKHETQIVSQEKMRKHKKTQTTNSVQNIIHHIRLVCVTVFSCFITISQLSSFLTKRQRNFSGGVRSPSLAIKLNECWDELQIVYSDWFMVCQFFVISFFMVVCTQCTAGIRRTLYNKNYNSCPKRLKPSKFHPNNS